MSFTVNQTGHDTHLYDPERHDNQIVAVFEDDAAAARAQDELRQAGVPESAMRLVSAPVASTPAEPESAGDQILGAFMSLFGSSEDHQHYAQAVGHGHAMLVVTPSGEIDRHHLIEVLERSNPIDFDAKLEEWRQAGYEGMAEPQAATAGERRVGRRETTPGTSRVRSYIADREGNGMGTGGTITNATPNAQSSGTNAPPR